MVLNITLIVIAYLLGSIPSAVWIGRRFYGIDVREHGSHNAGATNTLRVLGLRAALPVFGIDMLKGFVAVMLSHLTAYENGSDAMFDLKIALVAAAVIGHILPLFAGFRGGKGVATLAGAVVVPVDFRDRLRNHPLCIARFDQRRDRVPDLRNRRIRRTVGIADRIQLRHRGVAAVYPPQEHPAAVRPQRIEDLSVQKKGQKITASRNNPFCKGAGKRISQNSLFLRKRILLPAGTDDLTRRRAKTDPI